MLACLGYHITPKVREQSRLDSLHVRRVRGLWEAGGLQVTA